ncbi:hypothetical protein C4D60_Mb09t04260 [Musa balbisiana]|uniref:Uncharacterized protein n=1 Tax=Musa balbisiana TaxID=52838 RepID=A0A4S8IDY2_MUSBA|nr:hypothetical protein C4D60_Mb09t04260 [Musa balbisiana]
MDTRDSSRMGSLVSDVNSQGEEKKNLLLLDRIAFQSTHLSWKDMNGSNNIYCACTARFEVANAVVV